MKTAMKKIFSLLLAAVLLVGVLPFQAFAEEVIVEAIVPPATRVEPSAEAIVPPAEAIIPDDDDDETAGAPEEKGIIDLIPCQVCLWFKWDVTYDHHDWDHCAECYKLDGHFEKCSKWICEDCGKKPCVCDEEEKPSKPVQETVTVKLDYAEGSEEENYMPSYTIDKGTSLGDRLPENPQRNGLTFKGWYDGDKKVDSDTPINQDVTLTAKWDAQRYTLTLDENRKEEEMVNRVKRVTYGQPVGDLGEPTRDGYTFKGWFDKDGKQYTAETIYKVAGDTTVYAKWEKNGSNRPGSDRDDKYTVTVDLNYDRKKGEILENVPKGTKMGEVLDHVDRPFRRGYHFAGWYWDDSCRDRDAVKLSDRVTEDCTIYAKWVREEVHHEAMLKIYLNGDTKSAAKIVDLHDYAKDGWISMDEVKEIVKKYYTSKDSNGMYYSGLFDGENWKNYVRNHKHDGSKHIEVEKDSDTVVYVMVHNAKVRSSAAADTTNPKTGDMIMMPAAVLGLSASALAVLFYLNKKRAL